jgi:hypothetical protein
MTASPPPHPKAPPAQRAYSRRGFLARGGAVGAVLIVTPTAILSPDRAWGLAPQALSPEAMATLVTLARDIYPHDRVPDRFYAVAVKSHDETAASDAAHKALIEEGVADLDRRAGPSGYRLTRWEDERLAILREIEATPFFQTVRGGLVTGLYNQQELWPLFGYEGESYSQGGYITRGFDDIDWL